MMKPYPLSVLLVLAVFVYYATGYLMGIVCILANVLLWGRINVFGYIMPFYPLIAGFLSGHMTGKHRKNRAGIALALVIPLLLAFAETHYFHAEFLRVIMHPVPHFKIRFPTVLYYPMIAACAFWGYRLGLKKY